LRTEAARQESFRNWTFDEKCHFDEVAHRYDELCGLLLPYFELWKRREANDILALLEARSVQLVLDLGCGTGATLRHLPPTRRLRYVGVDISPKMIRVTEQKVADRSDIFLVVADSLSLPFREATFDIAYAIAALHHMPEPERVLREVARALKSGSRFLLVEPVDSALFQLARKLGFGVVARVSRSPRERPLPLRQLMIAVESTFAVERMEFRGYLGKVLSRRFRSATVGRFFFLLDVLLSRLPIVRRLGLNVCLVLVCNEKSFGVRGNGKGEN